MHCVKADCCTSSTAAILDAVTAVLRLRYSSPSALWLYEYQRRLPTSNWINLWQTQSI